MLGSPEQAPGWPKPQGWDEPRAAVAHRRQGLAGTCWVAELRRGQGCWTWEEEPSPETLGPGGSHLVTSRGVPRAVVASWVQGQGPCPSSLFSFLFVSSSVYALSCFLLS